MRTAQRLIKAFALVLAVCLMLSMGAAVVGGVMFLAALSGSEDINWGNTGDWTGSEYAEAEVWTLEMNVKATSVKFRVADDERPVRVETNNEYITVWTDEGRGKLNIVEKSHGVFGWGGTGEVIVYVKEGMKFDEVNVEIGAGTLDVEQLATKKLRLELGAGKTRIDGLEVTEEAEIDGGAGMLEIRGGKLRNARIELGAGKAEIRAKLGGHSKIESGVGRLELGLVGRESDYRLNIDKGLGSVEYDGRNVNDGERIGDGNNVVDIKSGVGSVEIRMAEE